MSGGYAQQGKCSKGEFGGTCDFSSIQAWRRNELKGTVDWFVNQELSDTNSWRTYDFDYSVTGLERKYVHSLCEGTGVQTQSYGKGKWRYLHLSWPLSTEAKKMRQKIPDNEKARGKGKGGGGGSIVKQKSQDFLKTSSQGPVEPVTMTTDAVYLRTQCTNDDTRKGKCVANNGDCRACLEPNYPKLCKLFPVSTDSKDHGPNKFFLVMEAKGKDRTLGLDPEHFQKCVPVTFDELYWTDSWDPADKSHAGATAWEIIPAPEDHPGGGTGRYYIIHSNGKFCGLWYDGLKLCDEKTTFPWEFVAADGSTVTPMGERVQTKVDVSKPQADAYIVTCGTDKGEDGDLCIELSGLYKRVKPQKAHRQLFAREPDKHGYIAKLAHSNGHGTWEITNGRGEQNRWSVFCTFRKSNTPPASGWASSTGSGDLPTFEVQSEGGKKKKKEPPTTPLPSDDEPDIFIDVSEIIIPMIGLPVYLCKSQVEKLRIMLANNEKIMYIDIEGLFNYQDRSHDDILVPIDSREDPEDFLKSGAKTAARRFVEEAASCEARTDEEKPLPITVRRWLVEHCDADSEGRYDYPSSVESHGCDDLGPYGEPWDGNDDEDSDE